LNWIVLAKSPTLCCTDSWTE